MRTNAPSTAKNKNVSNIEQNTQLKIPQVKKDDRFNKKKQKLENILGNIKSNTVKNKHVIERNRKMSESTEGDISDMSFNEEEILKNLENMDIPVEDTDKYIEDCVSIEKDIKKDKIHSDLIIKNELSIKNNKAEIFNLPLLKIKEEIHDQISIKSSVSDVDSIPDSNVQFNSDFSLEESSNVDKKTDEIIILDSCTNSSIGYNEDSSSILDAECNSFTKIVNNSPDEQKKTDIIEEENSNIEKNIFFPDKKIIKDLSEYITVYKITPEKFKGINFDDNIKSQECNNKTKLDVRGKLDDFFKQCKSTKRSKKTENPIPANSTAVKEETIDIENENSEEKTGLEEENRLKRCDYCIVKTENGTKDFSCEKCEKAPILTCGLCNFLADTKEIYKNHVSSCKDGARISWSHNLVLNQT